MKHLLWRLTWRPRLFWWRLRHEVYYHEVVAPVPVEPIEPSGGDDTANIQQAIDKAAHEPEWFAEITATYQRKWYRWFIKKPVLTATARFRAGTYTIGQPLQIGSNISIIGRSESSPSGRESDKVEG